MVSKLFKCLGCSQFTRYMHHLCEEKIAHLAVAKALETFTCTYAQRLCMLRNVS